MGVYYIYNYYLSNRIVYYTVAYIREPTATALAPVPRSSHAGFFNSVKNNVALVVISSLAILLLMLLLVAILLLGRTRARQRELSAANRWVDRNPHFKQLDRVFPLAEHHHAMNSFPRVNRSDPVHVALCWTALWLVPRRAMWEIRAPHARVMWACRTSRTSVSHA